jgi:hypothetical protein
MPYVLRESMDEVTEFNACDKADDYKGKKKKEELGITFIKKVGESPNCEWIYAKQEKLIKGTRDKYQKWTWRN